MSDLFAPATVELLPTQPPALVILPARAPGQLTARDERALWARDRAAWIEYVAPGMAAKLEAGGLDEIRASWRYLRSDYRRAVWARLPRTTRTLVEAVHREPPPLEPPT